MLTKSEVKYIQSLSQKKFRDEEGCYLVEGPKIVKEALLDGSVEVKRLLAVEAWLSANTDALGAVKGEVVASYELQKMSQLKTANEVMALVQMPAVNSFKFEKNTLTLMLDGIQDPGNLGTIIRIADWFGIRQIICSNDSADAYNSKVVQSAMGSIFRTNIVYTDLESWVVENNDVLLYGAALDGKPLQSFSKLEKGVIIIGNESKGIRSGLMSNIREKITIQKWGGAESLNAAVATGIILSHLR